MGLPEKFPDRQREIWELISCCRGLPRISCPARPVSPLGPVAVPGSRSDNTGLDVGEKSVQNPRGRAATSYRPVITARASADSRRRGAHGWDSHSAVVVGGTTPRGGRRGRGKCGAATRAVWAAYSRTRRAFVVPRRRIPSPNCGNGTNPARAFPRSRTMAGKPAAEQWRQEVRRIRRASQGRSRSGVATTDAEDGTGEGPHRAAAGPLVVVRLIVSTQGVCRPRHRSPSRTDAVRRSRHDAPAQSVEPAWTGRPPGTGAPEDRERDDTRSR